MSEMVDRVARAIYDANGFADRPWIYQAEDVQYDYRGLARAAIEAMREPTVRMYEASRFPNAGSIGDQWRAMIDTALWPYADTPARVSPGWFDVAALFTAIAHGNDQHRAWLLAALRAYRDGEPIPPAKAVGELR